MLSRPHNPFSSQKVTQLLHARSALRVAVFLREKSPLYPLEGDAAVSRACSTLNVDPVDGGAKLLPVWEVRRMALFAFDLWNAGYRWATAHHAADLPVVLVDYGRRLSYVRVAGQELRDEVNGFIADQHRLPLHGWEARPLNSRTKQGPCPRT